MAGSTYEGIRRAVSLLQGATAGYTDVLTTAEAASAITDAAGTNAFGELGFTVADLSTAVGQLNRVVRAHSELAALGPDDALTYDVIAPNPGWSEEPILGAQATLNYRISITGTGPAGDIERFIQQLVPGPLFGTLGDALDYFGGAVDDYLDVHGIEIDPDSLEIGVESITYI